MSTLTEQVASLTLDFENSSKETFEKLKEALESYHEMVDRGILSPRKNNVKLCPMNIYFSESNIRF